MKPVEVLRHLRAAGVRLAIEGDRLKVSAPRGALSGELREAIKQSKSELIQLLSSGSGSPEPALHREPDAPLTLSPNQERLWSLVTRSPDSSRFNLPSALELRGTLDVARLRRAFQAVLERHDVLRAAIRTEGGRRTLRLAPIPDVLRVLAAPPGADDAWVEEQMRQAVEEPLKLAEGEGIRALLLSLAAEHHVLLIVMHHLVADGGSFEVLFAELSEHFRALEKGDEPAAAPLPLQFNDVARWQQEALGTLASQRAEAFWTELFTPPPPPLGLPRTDPASPARRTSIPLPTELLAELESLALEESTSGFVVALAVWATVVAGLSGNQEVVVCIPSSGRNRDEFRTLIGYFNNVLPLRLELPAGGTFRDAVRMTRSRVLEAQRHEELPFQRIAALPATRRLPLARVLFNYHATPLVLPDFAGVSVDTLDVSTSHSDFDLGFSVLPHSGGLRCTLEHRDGVIGNAAPDRVLEHYVAQLAQAVRDPDGQPAGGVANPLAALSSQRRPADTQGRAEEARWTQEPTEAIAATDPLELQLTLIWEHVLGVRPIRPDDDFFDLGGHSLLAVRILDTIERELGVRLTLGALVDSPTVEELAKTVRSAGWAPAAHCLVPMSGGSHGDPLVFVHSFEGHTFVFHELVRHLDDRVPIYGLQAVGLGDNTTPHRTVEEMAGHYVEILDQEFGTRPLSLVGMCFGLSVSLEIARRRMVQGKPVRLIMIDGAWDHLEPGYPQGTSSPVRWLKAKARRGLDHTKWTIDAFRRRFTASPYARREAAIRRRTVDAWYAYYPKPYDGPVTFIRAKETAENPEKAWHLGAMESIALGGVRTVVIPGHHLTMLREPFVNALADEVLKASGWGEAEGPD